MDVFSVLTLALMLVRTTEVNSKTSLLFLQAFSFNSSANNGCHKDSVNTSSNMKDLLFIKLTEKWADEFDKLVYVLSTVSHVREHAQLKPVIESPSKRKHNIDLLNDIALALTTGAKRRCCCSHDETECHRYRNFFYSKQAPCNGSLDVYLQAIKEAIANVKGAESCNNVAPSQDNGTPKNPCDTNPKMARAWFHSNH